MMHGIQGIDIVHWQVDDDVALGLFQPWHAPEVFNLVESSRVHLRRWLPWVDQQQRVEDAQAFIQDAIEQFVEGEAVHVGIWYRDRLAGVIGYHRIDNAHRVGEIGYWLGEQYQGRGIMTRACRAMVAYGFAELKLNRIEIKCTPENVRSRAVPERLGFREEGILREAETMGSVYVDNIVYGLFAQDDCRHMRTDQAPDDGA